MTSAHAQALLDRYGPNAIAVERPSRFGLLARRLWGPIPWVLEGALILTLLTRQYADAVAIAFLLIFNAVVAAWQEGRADNALELLRSRIVANVRVERDGRWTTLPADRLVPGDVVHLGAGDVAAADIRLRGGWLAVDASVLTGEALPKTIRSGSPVYAGSIVRSGNAEGVVTATGVSTKFGRAAELVRVAKSSGTLERLVSQLVSALSVVSVAVVAIVAATALREGTNIVDVAVFAAMILLASVPIALPAAFTLATTLGSLELAKRGALVTRLSAVEDAASMDVLCTDKTGTITQNRVVVGDCVPYAPYSDADVAALAAAASDEAQKDLIDAAVLRYARERGIAPIEQTAFTPFDPAMKRSSAKIVWRGAEATVWKGALPALRPLLVLPPATLDRDVERLAASGARVLAVVLARGTTVEAVGLLAFSDPPRPDAAELIAKMRDLGVAVRLLTGDAAPTALQVARSVGIAADAVRASVTPEEKLAAIRDLQRQRHVVGMTGDGVNDAPALKQANVGIAVATATDVAKAAAGIVLTDPGLSNVVEAIQSGRQVYERMLTYTIMKLVKYFEIVGILVVGFFVTKSLLLTPGLMVALLVLNDFVTLSIATDAVSVSRAFDAWHVGKLLAAAVVLAVFTAGAVAGTIGMVAHVWRLNAAELRGTVFLALAVMGQIAAFVVRDRRAFVGLPPSRCLLATAVLALAAVAAMALRGALMPPLPAGAVAAAFGMLLVAGLLLNAVKLPVFRLSGLR